LVDIYPSGAQDAYGRRGTQADVGLVGPPMWGDPPEILYTYFGEFLFRDCPKSLVGFGLEPYESKNGTN
jgi:hypothetical protein